MSNEKIIIGCSTFNESYWKGVFYPEDLPRKDWFAYYCKHFNTYEMNSSFYKFPTAKVLQGWYQKAPDGFLFSVKMYKGVTHFKRFNDCERLIAEFYAVCRDNLKEKLACVLFQLPPSFSYSEEKLELILNAIDFSFTNVIEFRNESWWRSDVYESLRQKDVVFCNVSYPKLPETIVATTTTGYVRFHGVPKLFYSGYGYEALKRWYNDIMRHDLEKTFIYFNNTASEHGILDALELNKIANKATR
jgi:uncharacterized protein YecE (DUF72 family)